MIDMILVIMITLLLSVIFAVPVVAVVALLPAVALVPLARAFTPPEADAHSPSTPRPSSTSETSWSVSRSAA